MTEGEVGRADLVHQISTRRKREGLQSRYRRSWGITLNTVLADVAASLRRALPGVIATDHECMWIQVNAVEPGDSFSRFLVLTKLLGIQVWL